MNSTRHDSINSFLLYLFLIILVALVFRLIGITREPFWIDEVISVEMSSGNVQNIFNTFKRAAQSIHPPAYYLGLRMWRNLLGSSEAILHGYSMLWSILGLVAVVLLASDVSGRRRIGLMAGLLVAVNPLDIYYAQETRMYAQVAALGTLSSWFLWRWISSEERRNFFLDFGIWGYLYCLSSVLLLFSHYVSIFILLAQGIIALSCFSYKSRIRSIVSYLLVAVICIIFFIPWYQFTQCFRTGLYSADILGWMPMPHLQDFSVFLAKDFFFGPARLTENIWMVIISSVLIIATLSIACRLFFRNSSLRSCVLFHGWMLFTPVLLAVIASHVYHPVYYHKKFSILVSSPLLILCALTWEYAGNSKWQGRVWYLILCFIMLCGSFFQYQVITKPRMREFARIYNDKGTPDFMVFSPSYEARTASYYLKKKIKNPTREEIEEGLRSDRMLSIWIITDLFYRGKMSTKDRKMYEWLIGLAGDMETDIFEKREVNMLKVPPL